MFDRLIDHSVDRGMISGNRFVCDTPRMRTYFETRAPLSFGGDRVEFQRNLFVLKSRMADLDRVVDELCDSSLCFDDVVDGLIDSRFVEDLVIDSVRECFVRSSKFRDDVKNAVRSQYGTRNRRLALFLEHSDVVCEVIIPFRFNDSIVDARFELVFDGSLLKDDRLSKCHARFVESRKRGLR